MYSHHLQVFTYQNKTLFLPLRRSKYQAEIERGSEESQGLCDIKSALEGGQPAARNCLHSPLAHHCFQVLRNSPEDCGWLEQVVLAPMLP